VQQVQGIHAATSKVENTAQGLSCQLTFVHELSKVGCFIGYHKVPLGGLPFNTIKLTLL